MYRIGIAALVIVSLAIAGIVLKRRIEQKRQAELERRAERKRQAELELKQ